MLDILKDIEKDIPAFCDDREGWETLDITYNPPHVSRVWRQVGDYRLYLHRIYPCTTEQALFHPHPWPSAIYIASGEYEMGIAEQINLTWEGHKGQLAAPNKDKLSARMILPAGTYYEMTDPTGWHYVRPLRVVHSVMVTGKPSEEWKKVSQPNKFKHVPKELGTGTKHDILGFFKQHYKPNKSSILNEAMNILQGARV